MPCGGAQGQAKCLTMLLVHLAASAPTPTSQSRPPPHPPNPQHTSRREPQHTPCIHTHARATSPARSVPPVSLPPPAGPTCWTLTTPHPPVPPCSPVPSPHQLRPQGACWPRTPALPPGALVPHGPEPSGFKPPAGYMPPSGTLGLGRMQGPPHRRSPPQVQAAALHQRVRPVGAEREERDGDVRHAHKLAPVVLGEHLRGWGWGRGGQRVWVVCVGVG